MSNYVIMRSSKLKTFGNIGASLAHCYRERQTDNADPDKLQANEHRLAQSAETAMAALKARLPEKRRKDAVLAIEYVMTASPEWFEFRSERIEKVFFDRSIKWLEEKYGKENIIVATIHRDEKTPHLSAFVVPLSLNKKNEPVLNANKYIGNKKQMSEDQTSFAKCFEDLGLKRGIQGSKARHVELKEHYAQLKKRTCFPQISEAELQPAVLDEGSLFGFGLKREMPSQVIKRVNDRLRLQFEPVLEKAKEYDAQEQGRKVMEKQLADLRETARLADEARKKAEKERDDAKKEMLSLRNKFQKILTQLENLILFGGEALEAKRNELRKKRELEKLRRRSVGPER